MRSLIDEIAYSIIAPATKKRLFSAPHVPFVRYLGCYQEAFETGVVLGYTFRTKLGSFAKLFSLPDSEQKLIVFMQELAKQRLTEVGNAKTFFELAMVAEENRVDANWQASGVTEMQSQRLKKRLKMPLEQVFKNLHVAVSTGIGLGSAFPELTEQLWNVEHEALVSRDEWAKWRKAGLDIPNEPEEPITLKKRIEQLLPFVELFISNYRPELLAEFKQT